MTDTSPNARIMRTFEVVVVLAVELLLAVAVAIAIMILYVLFFNGLRANLTAFESVSDVQAALMRVFGGVLTVLLGLELIETLKTYFVEHHVRAEMIITVALIAVGRHVIQIDFEHTSGLSLLGVAALLLSLAIGFLLIRRAQSHSGDAHMP